jgi:prepilin-type N-terminal cleavage/methylation domain-containing protein
MRQSLNQKGFAIIELALVVIVVGVVAFAGYHLYSSRQSNSSKADVVAPAGTTAATTGSTNSAVTTVPPITNTSDLDSAAATLNQTDPSGSNSSDDSQLSSQANF